jgi:hypothetical protein
MTHIFPAPTLQNLSASFAPISLKQMEAVALLNRVDTKFILNTAQLLHALAALQPDYWMLSINGQRQNRYRTLYFDTPVFDLYHDHVNGRAERYKVRSREYLDSRLAFLEVKHKTRKDRTIKDRIPTPAQVTSFTPETSAWLEGIAPLSGGALRPVLWNTFTRLTLVSKHGAERLTLDVNLAFHANGEIARLDGFAIAEVKTTSAHADSPFLAHMRGEHIHSRGFSKYSIGVAMLYPQVKKNPLKAKLLWLEREGREVQVASGKW